MWVDQIENEYFIAILAASGQVWTRDPRPSRHEAEPLGWIISGGLREDHVQQQTDHKGDI